MVATVRPLVTDALLARLRQAAYRRTYQDTCVILRPVSQRTRAAGQRQNVPPEPIATIPCRRARDFQPGREQSVGEGLTGITYAVVYTSPNDPAPQPQDILEITGRYTPATIRVHVTESELLNTDPLERITRGTVRKPDAGATG